MYSGVLDLCNSILSGHENDGTDFGALLRCLMIYHSHEIHGRGDIAVNVLEFPTRTSHLAWGLIGYGNAQRGFFCKHQSNPDNFSYASPVSRFHADAEES